MATPAQAVAQLVAAGELAPAETPLAAATNSAADRLMSSPNTTDNLRARIARAAAVAHAHAADEYGLDSELPPVLILTRRHPGTPYARTPDGVTPIHSDQRADDSHRWRVGVCAATAEPTPAGTIALAGTALVCRDVAAHLDRLAGSQTARAAARMRSEAKSYRAHATAATAALDASLAWVDVAAQTALPPVNPTLPVRLRGPL